jgi:hypothetical protein
MTSKEQTDRGQKKGWKRMKQLPDWMYHASEESFTCQFTSVAESGTPVGLPVILNHFDPDSGTLIISSAVGMKRLTLSAVLRTASRAE